MQTGQTSNLAILFTVKGGATLEAILHSTFAPYRVRGEWFRLDRGQIEQAAIIGIRNEMQQPEKDYCYMEYEDVALEAEQEKNNEQAESFPEEASLIFQWIHNALHFREFGTEAFFASEKDEKGRRTVYIYPSALEDAWALCMPKKMKPSAQTLYKILKRIAPDQTTVVGFAGGEKRNVRVVVRQKLEAWFRNYNSASLNLESQLERLADACPVKIAP